MGLLVVNQQQVVELLPMRDCIEAVARALRAQSRGENRLPLRKILWQPDRRGALGVMPAYLADPPALGLKVISFFPGNEHTELESHQGAVMLFDVTDGRPLVLVDAGEITAIRTAAASGVATRALARDDSKSLAILGCGTQARTHLAAMREVRDIETVRAWSRTRDSAERFAAGAEMAIEVVDTARAAVEGADIVCTLTAAKEPILEGAWLAPGTHVNAVGACQPTTRELDTRAVQRGSMFVDCRESANHEAGDYLIPQQEGAVGDDFIRGEIGQVLAGTIAGRTSGEEITVFESLGIGVEDLAAASVVLRNARASGKGTEIALGGSRLG